MLENFDLDAARKKHVRSEYRRFRHQMEESYALASSTPPAPWTQDLDFEGLEVPSVDEHYSRRMHYANIPDNEFGNIPRQDVYEPSAAANSRIKRRERALLNLQNVVKTQKHDEEADFGPRINRMFADLYKDIDEKTGTELEESLARGQAKESIRLKRAQLAVQSKEVNLFNSQRGLQLMAKQLRNYVETTKKALDISGGTAPTSSQDGDILRSYTKEAAMLQKEIQGRYKQQQERLRLAQARNALLKRLHAQIQQK